MPVTDDGPSARDFERLSVAVDRLTRTVEGLPEKIAEIYVRQDVYKAEKKAQDHEIDTLNSMATWAIRLVLGVVMVAILGVVVTQTGGA